MDWVYHLLWTIIAITGYLLGRAEGSLASLSKSHQILSDVVRGMNTYQETDDGQEDEG